MTMHDAMARKTQADMLIERAAMQLQSLLEETAKALRPFPPFPGAFFTYGVEVSLEGVATPNFGCIVVGEDGKLYELEIQIDFNEDDGGVIDLVQARDETLKKLDDLHPKDHVILAYNAINQLTELILEQQEQNAAGTQG